MPTPSAKRALPQIAGTDSPDVPRDLNALIVALEAEVGYLAARDVLDTGMAGQTRAGRILTPADFTDLGLSAPLGLWLATSGANQINDQSGGARHLTNKGAVPFGTGIDGAASSAAIFSGSTAQALYRADTGAADPFRVKTGAWGCWFRTAKRNLSQSLLAKSSLASGQFGLNITVDLSNVIKAYGSSSGADTFNVLGATDVADDRWHQVIVTCDGLQFKLFVDGVLEGVTFVQALMWPSSAPLNIGGYGADGALATNSPSYGRVDETFVLGDVPSDDQVRLLYAVKLPHGAPRSPRRAGLAVRRRRRGAALVAGDFPSQPLRGHNLAGSLADFGSNNVALIANPGTGAIVDVVGPDGLANGARSYSGAHTGDSATDAGLPAALTSRSYGIWFKSTSTAGAGLIGWGTDGTADARIFLMAGGALQASSGADQVQMTTGTLNDGLWHHVVVVEDNAAADGVKRKMYVDGRLTGGSTVMNAITLAGANRFRVGAGITGTFPLNGQLGRGFVSGVPFAPDQVIKLYAKGSQDLGRSPKNPGDHIERIDATNIYFIGDALDPQYQVELEVAA